MKHLMDPEINNLLEIIRFSLWGGKKPAFFVTEEIYREFCSHAVTALPAGVLSELDMTDELMSAWKKEICYQVARQMNYSYEQAALPVNVPYVILKGSAAAQYYPNIEYRLSGDIDIMTAREDFETAYRQLLDGGYILCKDKNREKELIKRGVVVELHRYFASLNDPVKAAYMDDLIISNINPSHILPDLVNGLVLLEHISQHLEHGLGLRQIIDWMMFADKCLDDKNWAVFKEMSDRIGLTKLAVVTTRMCELYLGLSIVPEADLLPKKELQLSGRQFCASADEHLCAQLMEYVLDCGDFGHKWTEDSQVSEKVLTKLHSPKKIFSMLQENGLYNWKAARECRFLRPFAWIYQIGHYVKKGLSRRNAFHTLKNEFRSAKGKKDILDALEVKQTDKGLVIYKDGKYVSTK